MAWFNNLGDLAGDIGSVAKNPLVDAGLGVLTGGAAIPLLAGTAGNLLSKGGQQQPQSGGGAIPLSAFNTSGGMVGADASAPAEQNQGSGILGSLEGLAGKAGSFLTGNNGGNALGALGAVSSYLDQKKSTDLAKQALGSVEQSYAERAPLRTQGLNTLAQSQVGNPYARGA